MWDEYGEISGLYAPLPTRCELIQYGGVPYIRYEFAWGERAAVELEYCGIMTRFQYKDDLFGESNRALLPTMDLIHIQNQGIEEGVKSAATYRFMAQLSNFAKAEELKAKMILQIHDELLFDTPCGEVERVKAVVKREMEGAMNLGVPLAVSVGAGRNWLEAH